MLMQYFRATSLAESRSNSLQQQLVSKEREEKESLQQELDEANRMQSALLPLRSPKISWLDMAGASIPASEVGGDFFDYLIDEKTPKIAIADVSGKGLKAAMTAVMASGILNLAAQYKTVPSSIMSDMNNTLSQTMEQDMNVTMVLAQFDIQKKKMILANAGQHAYPLLKRGSSVEPIKAKGLALGMIPSITYRPITVDLQLGDLLLFMTDGITEPRNAEGLMYEESGRFHQVLSALSDELNAEEVIENIIQDVIDHMVDGEERGDDITLVAVKVT
jgi:sigma-B regulation protein RsbU (phosphoserine phosphatase)